MNKKILVIGAGQLGSRYIQGLARYAQKSVVDVVDPSKKSLEIAKTRWEEVLSKSIIEHNLSFNLNLNKPKKNYDLAIVATGSKERAKIIEYYSKVTTVDYWIIEKTLAQTPSDLEKISISVQNSLGAWVNTSRRIQKLYKKLKEEIKMVSPVSMSVYGGNWGMACNAIHFFDLLSWMTRENVVDINTSGLSKNWHESKRPGYFDIFGGIKVNFNNGSLLSLESNNSDAPVIIEIKSKDKVWKVYESEGKVTSSEGKIIRENLELQTTLTARVVDSIISNKNCGLPTLSESLNIHHPFLEAMLEHWNTTNGGRHKFVPLT